MEPKTVFHGLAALQFWFGCFYHWNFIKVPPEASAMGDSFVGWRNLRFLTYLDGLIQSTFFTICFLNDFIGTNEKVPVDPPRIRRIKDMMLPCLAFPIAMFVSSTFWGLYAVDREFVLPKALDGYFPWWLNHIMHTNIFIFINIELATTYRAYPDRKTGLTIVLSFFTAYLVWVHIIHACSDLWVYPVLGTMNLPLRIVFFGFMLGLVALLYLLGEKINELVWGQQQQ